MRILFALFICLAINATVFSDQNDNVQANATEEELPPINASVGSDANDLADGSGAVLPEDMDRNDAIQTNTTEEELPPINASIGSDAYDLADGSGAVLPEGMDRNDAIQTNATEEGLPPINASLGSDANDLADGSGAVLPEGMDSNVLPVNEPDEGMSYQAESASDFDEGMSYQADAADYGDGDSFAGDCNACCDDDWHLWAFDNYYFVGITAGRGLSYDRGYGTVGIFMTPPAFRHSCWVPFLDVRGHWLFDGQGAANVGGGIRYITSWDLVVGVNAYYDYRRFKNCNLNQLGVGFEILSRWVDFRVNGYFPVDKNHRKGTLIGFGDCIYAARFHYCQAFRGVDAELGFWIWKKTNCNWFGLYFAAGPYYYERDERKHTVRDHDRSFSGGQARLLARITDYIDVSISGTYDDFYHGTFQGRITLTIPFCEPIRSLTNCYCSCPCLPCLDWQIMTQPVQRNDIIVAEDECVFLWNWSDACPCSDCCDYTCPSHTCGCSDDYSKRSWHSSEFSSGFFPFPYECSECRSSRSCFGESLFSEMFFGESCSSYSD